MSPRVAYWTSAFDRDMEAVASEVALLRRHSPGSVIWGLDHRRWVRFSWRRGFSVHPRLHLLFRAATRLLERAFHLNHVVGSVDDWFYLQGVRRRPTVLTVVARATPVDASLLDRVARFVVEYPGGILDLEQLGIARDRVRVILPPVDLERFMPRQAPREPFTVLFASSPDRESWLDARGVPQLLDAAVLRPRMRFRLLWRPWGDSVSRVRQMIAERGLSNVELCVGLCSAMERQYEAAHVSVAPFTDPSRSKAAPNSLIESLACGRPVLLTEVVGLANMVREARAGAVCEATGPALAENLDRLEAEWDRYSHNARGLAGKLFGAEIFLKSYQDLYRDVLGCE